MPAHHRRDSTRAPRQRALVASALPRLPACDQARVQGCGCFRPIFPAAPLRCAGRCSRVVGRAPLSSRSVPLEARRPRHTSGCASAHVTPCACAPPCRGKIACCRRRRVDWTGAGGLALHAEPFRAQQQGERERRSSGAAGTWPGPQPAWRTAAGAALSRCSTAGPAAVRCGRCYKYSRCGAPRRPHRRRWRRQQLRSTAAAGSGTFLRRNHGTGGQPCQ